MVRTSETIKTHIFCSIRAFRQLELMRIEELIENWYELQRNLYLQVAREFILERLIRKTRLYTLLASCQCVSPNRIKLKPAIACLQFALAPA